MGSFHRWWLICLPVWPALDIVGLMRKALFAVIALVASHTQVMAQVLTADELQAKVVAITDAQNKVMMRGSTAADVDVLFTLYTPDFIYIHEAYGGAYTRDELHANTLRALEAGRYGGLEPRYRVIAMIPGHNGIAVEREEVSRGIAKRHLAVFEFRDDKVSRIIEYWR